MSIALRDTGERTMDADAIRTKIKQTIYRVTGIDAATIADTASYETDLGLDSLSILEIAVDVENQFKFQASDDELSSIHTVEDAVSLVKKRLSAEVR
jgi:acyl carrier protein